MTFPPLPPPRPGKMFGAVADAMHLTYSATVVLFWLLFNVMHRRRSSNWTDVQDTFYAFSIPPCTGVDKGGGRGHGLYGRTKKPFW